MANQSSSSTLDLNLDNYGLDELLALFKIDDITSEDNLSQAKSIALKMHPDKSGLDKDYFLFFSKAYKMLYNLHVIQDKTRERGKNSDYANYKDTMDSDNREILDKLLKDKRGKNTNGNQTNSNHEFNKWFNQEFESMRIKDEFVETGYGDWFQAEGDYKADNKANNKCDATLLSNRPKNIESIHRSIEERKRELYQVVKHEDIQDYNIVTTGFSDIGGVAPDNYSSGLFSDGLAFQDLKQAHTETVIPVDERDADKRQTSFDTLKHERETKISPLDQAAANARLQQQERQLREQGVQRMYKMMRQQEQVEKNNQEWWKKYKLLKG